MHESFEKFLGGFQIDQGFIEPIREQLLCTYRSLTVTDKEVVKAIKQSLAEIEVRIEKIQEHFAFGEIDRYVFEKVGGKLKEEKKKMEAQLEEPKIGYRTHPGSFKMA